MKNLILRALFSALKSRQSLFLENIALRHQLEILRRTRKTPRLKAQDRLLWVILSRIWINWKRDLAIVQPETVIGWLVGSRTGAVARRIALGCIRGFPLRARVGISVTPFPAPASSNAACGFTALRFPAHFASRFMGPIRSESLSTVGLRPRPTPLLPTESLTQEPQDNPAFPLMYIL
jgi:hypothetical protein